jgi:palmitoyltransferase ZDHHC9/14/18
MSVPPLEPIEQTQLNSDKNVIEAEVLSETDIEEALAWPSKNRLFCGKRLLLGPNRDMCPLVTGWISVFLAGGVFFSCVGPHLWTNISPAPVIVAAVFYCLDIYYYARACFSDPGILPRLNTQKALAAVSLGKYDEVKQRVETMRRRGDIYLTSHIAMGLPTDARPPCITCKIERPPLASHCRSCDQCVQGFDHHCNWIANDVGQRNHRWFVGFVMNTTFLTLFYPALAIWYFVDRGWSGDAEDYGAVVIIAGLLILFLFMSSVCYWHAELVFAGQTLKQRDSTGYRYVTCPLGVKNCLSFIFTYSPRPSLVRYKDFHDSGKIDGWQ